MTPEELIAKYEKELCSNCKSKCNCAIKINTQTFVLSGVTKELKTIKCENYQRSDAPKIFKDIQNWQRW